MKHQETDYFYKSVIFKGIVYFVFLMANLYAIYLFMRGHNLPGGGFIAGVCSSLGLLLLVFAIGIGGLRKVIKTNLLMLASFGVIISMITLLIPIFLGNTGMEHYHFKRETFLVWNNFYLGTPILFDLGVYLTVFGTLSYIIIEIGRFTRGFFGLQSEEPVFLLSEHHEPIEDIHTSCKNEEKL
jgi:multisubunit Na+/H+ antiporter MnhB subunit